MAMAFPCKCGYVFCNHHRYADQHLCDFDFKAAGKLKLEAANPVIVAEKVRKL